MMSRGFPNPYPRPHTCYFREFAYCGTRKNQRACAILDFFDRGYSLAALYLPPAAVGSLPLATPEGVYFGDIVISLSAAVEAAIGKAKKSDYG